MSGKMYVLEAQLPFHGSAVPVVAEELNSTKAFWDLIWD